MELTFGEYKLTPQDELNIVLSVKVKPKDGGESTKDKTIGYYSTVSGALNKVINLLLKSADEVEEPLALMDELLRVERDINKAFGHLSASKLKEM